MIYEEIVFFVLEDGEQTQLSKVETIVIAESKGEVLINTIDGDHTLYTEVYKRGIKRWQVWKAINK